MGLVEESKRPEVVEKDEMMRAANANFVNDGETKPKSSYPNPIMS